MVLGIIFIVVLVLGGLFEWYVYDRAMYWHDDSKRDPRNFPPPR